MISPRIIGAVRTEPKASREALQVDSLFLRRSSRCCGAQILKRVAVGSIDRLVLVGSIACRQVLEALKILQPETVSSWHRAGFRISECIGAGNHDSAGAGRKRPADIRQPTLEISFSTLPWGSTRGAPEIHFVPTAVITPRQSPRL
jgi:hypothetical protein